MGLVHTDLGIADWNLVIHTYNEKKTILTLNYFCLFFLYLSFNLLLYHVDLLLYRFVFSLITKIDHGQTLN